MVQLILTRARRTFSGIDYRMRKSGLTFREHVCSQEEPNMTNTSTAFVSSMNIFNHGVYRPMDKVHRNEHHPNFGSG